MPNWTLTVGNNIKKIPAGSYSVHTCGSIYRLIDNNLGEEIEQGIYIKIVDDTDSTVLEVGSL